jgi:L-lactate dehydrogenase complex protein LldF
MSSYVSFITGPKRSPPREGQKDDRPAEFHLVLMDNGRTRILADEQMRQSLYCIRCGACLNVCPVYQKIGGQAYGWIYPGPIGAVITPQLQSLKRASELPFASSLCGACKDACPVKINLPDLLLALRAQVKEDEGVKLAAQQIGERLAMRGYAVMARHPRWFAVAGHALRRLAQMLAEGGKITSVSAPPLSEWTNYRDLPAPPGRSFRERWNSTGSGSDRLSRQKEKQYRER